MLIAEDIYQRLDHISRVDDVPIRHIASRIINRPYQNGWLKVKNGIRVYPSIDVDICDSDRLILEKVAEKLSCSTDDALRAAVKYEYLRRCLRLAEYKKLKK